LFHLLVKALKLKLMKLLQATPKGHPTLLACIIMQKMLEVSDTIYMAQVGTTPALLLY